MFAKAARNKYRFASTKGQLTTEDLWDSPLDALNRMAQMVNKRIKEAEEESFIATPSASNVIDHDKLEILKHIIAVRLEENKAKSASIATAQQNARIRELIGKKKDEALGDKSIEELEKLLG